VKNLFALGFGHFLIDAISALIVFSFIITNTNTPSIAAAIIIYNILAFGSQIIIGELSDKYKKSREAAIAGTILGALSLILFNSFPWISIILIGFGNALFHIGAGTISLNLTPKKATAPGIFVAPGALGLLIGTLTAKLLGFTLIPFLVVSILFIPLLFYINIPNINYKMQNNKSNKEPYFLIFFLLLTILIRSFIGSTIVLPWKSNQSLLISLTIFIFLGKSLGGILADKFSFMKIGIASLILSSIMLSFYSNIPSIAITGMFLFNMTMPITLVALSNRMPGRSGFSFGLTCMALFIGTIPAMLGFQLIIPNYIKLAIILLSALFLYLGLRNSKN